MQRKRQTHFIGRQLDKKRLVNVKIYCQINEEVLLLLMLDFFAACIQCWRFKCVHWVTISVELVQKLNWCVHAVFAFTLNARAYVSPNDFFEEFFFSWMCILSIFSQKKNRRKIIVSAVNFLNINRYNIKVDFSFVFFICGWAFQRVSLYIYLLILIPIPILYLNEKLPKLLRWIEGCVNCTLNYCFSFLTFYNCMLNNMFGYYSPIFFETICFS